MEVSKTVRTYGINGHSYQKAVGAAADFVSVTEEESRHPHHPLADEAQLTSTASGGGLTLVDSTDRAEAIVRAWVAADTATVRLIQEARSIARTSSTVLSSRVKRSPGAIQSRPSASRFTASITICSGSSVTEAGC